MYTSFKYICTDWQTTEKVQRQHKQRLAKRDQTSAQYSREDESLTFLLFTPPVLSIHRTKKNCSRPKYSELPEVSTV